LRVRVEVAALKGERGEVRELRRRDEHDTVEVEVGEGGRKVGVDQGPVRVVGEAV
jgi:hypothetical protein